MAARNQWHRVFGVVLGSVLVAGIAGAGVACGIDDGELGGVQAESEVAVEAEAPGLRDRDAGYVFVDVGAWDDTNLSWPAVVRETAPDSNSSSGYRFLEVGAWDDTDINWP